MTAKKTTQPPDKPGAVDFNLDTFELEGTRPAPFTFVVHGKRFVTTDPADQDWQLLFSLNVNDPESVLRVALSGAYDEFAKIEGVSLRKLEALATAITNHYQQAMPADEGEGDAS